MSHFVAALGLVTVTLLVSAPPVTAARAVAWDPIERLEGTPQVIVEVGGKPRRYFPIPPGRPLEFPLDGPARVRIVSRAVVAKDARTPAIYNLRVTADGKVVGEARTESSQAPNARQRDGKGAVCKSRTLAFEVPAGRHRIAVGVDGVSALLVRILVASPQRDPGVKMVSLTPTIAARSVTVVEGERMIPYYTARVASPVVFRLVGPTTLELSSRLDFETSMRGPHRYRLAVRIDGGKAREEAFTTTKASTASYSESRDRVPSKLDRFVLQVGEGTHDVAVELIAPKKGTLQIHGRIPQPSIGNEE